LAQAYPADSLFIYRILKGNLAPGGAVAKITGKEGLEFTGKARTFDTEDAFVEAVEKGEIKKGEKTVAVLRYLGPKGGPGEWISHDFSFSTLWLLLAWELNLEIERFLGAYDTNVSLRSTPFSDSLPCLTISVHRRCSRRLFSFFFFAGEHVRISTESSFNLADGDECGIAFIYGASSCRSVGMRRGLVFCDTKPKMTRT
jgi:hypothetical protein